MPDETLHTITIEISTEAVRQMRREMLTIMVLVPTIAALVESLEEFTGISARSTVIGGQ